VMPETWRDDALAAKWEQLRTIRRRVTVPLEEARRANVIGASLQAAVTLKLAPDEAELLNAAEWAELAIVSDVRTVAGTGDDLAEITLAPGRKCDRCWRVLTEVGSQKAHPTLCLRCTDVVEAA
jgi:isoleucyl-tRNA synthetase